MALFGIGKTKAYLGIDIGASSIKMVEFREEKGRPKLHTYAYAERKAQDGYGTSLLDAPNLVVSTIKKMIAASKATASVAVTALPISQVFSSVLSVPKLSPQEQRGAIEVQARKLISVPIEEMVLNSKILTTAEEEKQAQGKLKNLRVLLTAAPKALVGKYISTFRSAGLELASLETEAFALIRSLVGKDKATLMIIDVGALRTSVLVIVGGVPYLSRSIDAGGLKMTTAAAASLGMPLVDAENMKMDVRSSSNKLASGKVLSKAFEPIADLIANEILFSLKLFAGLEDAQGKVVEKVILTGGGSLVPGLEAYLASKTNLRVFRGDPWARVLYPADARPLLDEIGARFSVAAGLAMREFDV